MNRFVLFAALFGLGAMWGTTVPLTKMAVSTGHHPFGLIFWQFALSGLVLFVLTLIRRSKLVFDRQHMLFFTVIAFTGTLIPNSTSYFASFHLPAGVMALVIALVPMFSLLVALVIRLEQFQVKRFIGVVLGAVAIALIALPDSSLPEPEKAIFVLVALVAPMFYGIEGNYLSLKRPKGTGPVATLFGASLVGIVVTSILVIGSGTFIDPRAGMGSPEWALVASSFLHVAAYTGYIWMVGKAGPTFSAQVAYLVTPAGVLASMLMLGERPSAYLWIALLVLLAGLSLVQPRQVEDMSLEVDGGIKNPD